VSGAEHDKTIETRIKLRKQMEQAIRIVGDVTCQCGDVLPMRCMFKCLYCGLWFCRICAHEHFGSEGGPVPVEQWRAEMDARQTLAQKGGG